MKPAVPPPMDPGELFGGLARRRVEYILIGAFGAVLHGSPLPTQDIDVCPARTEENLERLASFLLADALARWHTTGTPFASTLEEALERLSAEDLLSFETRYGRLDVVFEPAGTRGYRDLAKSAVVFEVGGVSVATASLRDLIRSKQSAARERDLQQLPTLRKLLEKLEGGTD